MLINLSICLPHPTVMNWMSWIPLVALTMVFNISGHSLQYFKVDFLVFLQVISQCITILLHNILMRKNKINTTKLLLLPSISIQSSLSYDRYIKCLPHPSYNEMNELALLLPFRLPLMTWSLLLQCGSFSWMGWFSSPIHFWCNMCNARFVIPSSECVCLVFGLRWMAWFPFTMHLSGLFLWLEGIFEGIF